MRIKLETELLIFIVLLSPPVVLDMQKRFIIIAIENKTKMFLGEFLNLLKITNKQ
jgi:hypothetical protein